MKNSIKYLFGTTIVVMISFAGLAQPEKLPVQTNRWAIQQDGSIEWKIDQRIPHYDHIEMSGEKISVWLQYGVDSNGQSFLNRTMVFPTFRLLPMRTTSHMMYDVKDEELPRFIINGRLLKSGVYNASVQSNMPEKVVSIRLKGLMEMKSEIGKDGLLKLKRTIFPSTVQPMALEEWLFTNEGAKAIKIEMEHLYRESAPAENLTSNGPHHFIVSTVNDGEKTLEPGDSVAFAIIYQATRHNDPAVVANVGQEKMARIQRISEILSRLQLETPDTVLNTMFAFAKIRGTESIYKTKGGYLHGPGGLRYYAAIWANDQAEYINPYFAFSGDEIGNKSAMNAFRWFARYMNPGYNPIPSSIISEGDGTWHGAKDRGDMAMIAYGAARYALAYGNVDSAKILWPLIEWCLEYLSRKVNENGVVTSNSDELEGRFPSGNANLNTSALYYDALISAQMLGKELGIEKIKTEKYREQANEMHINIEKFFGRKVEGFQTYRYYEGNDTLRAWITTPLTVNIFDRKEGTIAALFSPRLWTEDGLASLAGNKTFWDRSTLYGLRGAFAAGATEKALTFLTYYSQRRLLGEHVPYAVEAFPEGNQRHLSAESGLYCRIFTEGVFGMRPTGFHSFDITPRLPKEWDHMALHNIHSFQHDFDIDVIRTGKDQLKIKVVTATYKKTYKIRDGSTKRIEL